MSTLIFEGNTDLGRVKPMHAVNNGPVYKFTADQRISNLQAFVDAGIPYARNHDAAFYATYGGEHTVDVHNIFRNFDADENDPASYDFDLTDEYIKVCEYAGVKTFYRLGSKIEHAPKKYGTLPPPDFQKWARICEHIVAHYTEGWANGFKYDIEYWEIWNEPDMVADDADIVDKKTWGGTKAQFFDLFDITAKHLKARFPHLKIGGPAVTRATNPWCRDFLAFCRDHGTPLDFFSWHVYTSTPEKVLADTRLARDILDEFGFTKTESILNEWNYVKSWKGDDWVYSLKTEKGLKGSSFISAVMSSEQYAPLDLLMYYEARPCGMNGMFATDFVCDKLKGYYPFLYFGDLYRLGTAVRVSTDDEALYAVGAKSEDKAALMFTYYRDADEAEDKTVRIDVKDLGITGPVKATFRIVDADSDAAIVKEEILSGGNFRLYFKMKLFTTAEVVFERYEE